MKVINAFNVNSAYNYGLNMLIHHGEESSSRAGDVLVMPYPVTTVYANPQERVLLNVKRDANPFFHLFESLWMLSGRNDATWLDQFVGDFSSRFAEDGGRQHGAYGYRWRHHFDMEGGGEDSLPDQLEAIVRLLRANPNDRRVVLQMWDTMADLGANKRDVPCNTQAYIRIHDGCLDLTVCCRSNDAIWGAYGANAVHFSVLQEYLAGRIGVKIGTMYQISNNFHVYKDVLEKKFGTSESLQAVGENPYSRNDISHKPIGNNWTEWDADLKNFMEQPFDSVYKNSWFAQTAQPMLWAHMNYKKGDMESAIYMANQISSTDWRAAAVMWLERRDTL